MAGLKDAKGGSGNVGADFGPKATPTTTPQDASPPVASPPNTSPTTTVPSSFQSEADAILAKYGLSDEDQEPFTSNRWSIDSFDQVDSNEVLLIRTGRRARANWAEVDWAGDGGVGGIPGLTEEVISFEDWFLRDWSRLDRPMVEEYQRRLISLGYIDSNDPIVFGYNRDPATVNALMYFAKDAMMMGKDMPITTALRFYDDSFGNRKRGGGGAGGARPQLQLIDPVLIGQKLEEIGQAEWGMKLSGEQSARIVQMVHDLQREQFGQLVSGAPEVTDIDMGSRLIQAVREMDPAKANAHDAVESWGLFRGLLGGI